MLHAHTLAATEIGCNCDQGITLKNNQALSTFLLCLIALSRSSQKPNRSALWSKVLRASKVRRSRAKSIKRAQLLPYTPPQPKKGFFVQPFLLFGGVGNFFVDFLVAKLISKYLEPNIKSAG